ncbi:hypothetical protein, conserved [Eimeria acervulina]|uniref:Uncharacterized protein n=1 Tax=Eimeria acervulina TaxID=5801 RepID=U6H0E6_EIMAC|nr:hypothetical protein, conserved [Eimeria acervulina]CDI84239.1 hypothetical protein, conserved [Eimeria acervulina]
MRSLCLPDAFIEAATRQQQLEEAHALQQQQLQQHLQQQQQQQQYVVRAAAAYSTSTTGATAAAATGRAAVAVAPRLAAKGAAAAAAATAAAAAAAKAARNPQGPLWGFIRRAEASKTLDAFLKGDRDNTRLLVLAGPEGSGKASLLRDAAARLTQDKHKPPILLAFDVSMMAQRSFSGFLGVARAAAARQLGAACSDINPSLLLQHVAAACPSFAAGVSAALRYAEAAAAAAAGKQQQQPAAAAAAAAAAAVPLDWLSLNPRETNLITSVLKKLEDGATDAWDSLLEFVLGANNKSSAKPQAAIAGWTVSARDSAAALPRGAAAGASFTTWGCLQIHACARSLIPFNPDLFKPLLCTDWSVAEASYLAVGGNPRLLRLIFEDLEQATINFLQSLSKKAATTHQTPQQPVRDFDDEPSTLGGPQGGPQGAPQGAYEGAPQGAPQGPPQAAPQGVPHGAPHEAPHGAPQGAPKVGSQGAPQGAPKGGSQGAPEGAPGVEMCVLEGNAFYEGELLRGAASRLRVNYYSLSKKDGGYQQTVEEETLKKFAEVQRMQQERLRKMSETFLVKEFRRFEGKVIQFLNFPLVRKLREVSKSEVHFLVVVCETIREFLRRPYVLCEDLGQINNTVILGLLAANLVRPRLNPRRLEVCGVFEKNLLQAYCNQKYDNA